MSGAPQAGIPQDLTKTMRTQGMSTKDIFIALWKNVELIIANFKLAKAGESLEEALNMLNHLSLLIQESLGVASRPGGTPLPLKLKNDIEDATKNFTRIMNKANDSDTLKKELKTKHNKLVDSMSEFIFETHGKPGTNEIKEIDKGTTELMSDIKILAQKQHQILDELISLKKNDIDKLLNADLQKMVEEKLKQQQTLEEESALKSQR